MKLKFHRHPLLLVLALLCYANGYTQDSTSSFRVIAFYTAKNDAAHISFVHEAHQWFSLMAQQYHFVYDSTNNWQLMEPSFLSKYQVVIFLDTRPEAPAQRAAFQRYMEQGGGWIGFHFAAFALTPSDVPQNWHWYHETFLGSGSYVSNTWRPTVATLRVEDHQHPATRHLPDTFSAAPNEWYRWSNNLRKNKDIRVLLSIDSSSFPLGTGPKVHEIWHSGYYPVVWTNRRFKMLYINMGHNDMDYEHHTNQTLSSSFSSAAQNQLILAALLWMGRGEYWK